IFALLSALLLDGITRWTGVAASGVVLFGIALVFTFNALVAIIAAIPVGAAGEGIGESDVRVNFGGVTFFSGDHLYADNTGIIL
ncbi:hypothetical protein MJL27_27520, partial [Salmonella enterica subsp. enterica serovar Anatum]|nr:hypothetical protein [Salmonella enterica subsp. enterica serovar Anatum]